MWRQSITFFPFLSVLRTKVIVTLTTIVKTCSIIIKNGRINFLSLKNGLIRGLQMHSDLWHPTCTTLTVMWVIFLLVTKEYFHTSRLTLANVCTFCLYLLLGFLTLTFLIFLLNVNVPIFRPLAVFPDSSKAALYDKWSKKKLSRCPENFIQSSVYSVLQNSWF